MKKQSVMLLAIAFFVLAISSIMPQVQSRALAAQGTETKFLKSERGIPNQYIVVFKEDVASNKVAALTAELRGLYGGKVKYLYEHALKGFAVELAEPMAIALSKDPRIDHVTQDAEIELSATQFNPPWNLDRIDQRDLPLNGAYTYNNTGSGVSVYVIDTGIRRTHQEFGGRAFIAADFVGDGQNGNDCNGHGTHVAGTIGGNTYGVAKGATLYAVRVFSCSGGSAFSTIIAAVNWVTANHINPAVCNMSLGGSPPFPDLDTAVRNSIASGVTYTIAAGNGTNNDGVPIDVSNVSPARVAEAITVSATDISDNRASFANYGAGVDVFAPGVNVTSAWWFNDTATNTISGTSMAAPHAAGVVALYLQDHRNTNSSHPAVVHQMIQSNASLGRVINPGPSPNWLLYSGFNPTPANPIDNTRFFVWQLYLDVLSHGPDGGGFNSWTSQIEGCGGDAACLEARRTETAWGFIRSPEFLNRNPPPAGGPGNHTYDQDFVNQCYRVFLRRVPDALGAQWVDYLDSTGDERGVVHGFIYSAEYRARRFGPPPPLPSPSCDPDGSRQQACEENGGIWNATNCSCKLSPCRTCLQQ
jgi:hypothetical protein